MGTDGIVDLLPVEKGLIEGGHFRVPVVDLMELFRVGGLGPFHMAIELGRAGREDEEADAQLLTSLLELGTELAASIHLYGTDLKGHPLPYLLQS